MGSMTESPSSEPALPAGYSIRRATLERLHQWARDRGLSAVALHASDDGRPLYETLGYEATNEMWVKL